MRAVMGWLAGLSKRASRIGKSRLAGNRRAQADAGTLVPTAALRRHAGYSEFAPGATVAAILRRRGTVEDRRTHRRPESSVIEILELDAFVAPNLFNRAQRDAARFGIALLDLVDGALAHANAATEFALAPAEPGARPAPLGREGLPLEPEQFA